MEQSGGRPQPQPPVSQRPSDRPGGRAFALVGVLALVLVAGVIAWMINRDDGRDALLREEQRFPSPTTLAPATTTSVPGTSAPSPAPTPTGQVVAPTPAPTTVVPATPAPTPAPTTVPAAAATTTVPAAGATTTTPAGPTTTTAPPAYIAGLVPNVAAFADYLATPEAAKAEIDKLLKSGRHDVATLGPAPTICAAVRMTQPLAVKSRWERDGRRIASSDLGRRAAPGFGECLGNDGDPLENGSYQYVAIDSEGHESAAGGIVVGAARVEQRFANNGDEPVCLVRIAPSASRYFEVYVYTAKPILPGAEVSIAVGAVPQDVETVGCAGVDDVLATFSFDPVPGTVQPLRS